MESVVKQVLKLVQFTFWPLSRQNTMQVLLSDTELRYNSAIDSLPRIINFSISQYDPHGEILHAITIAIARLGSGKQRQLLFLCPRAIASFA